MLIGQVSSSTRESPAGQQCQRGQDQYAHIGADHVDLAMRGKLIIADDAVHHVKPMAIQGIDAAQGQTVITC